MYKTMNEESEQDHKTFKKNLTKGKWPFEVVQIGKYKEIGKGNAKYSISSICPTTSNDVFHHKDMCRILINLYNNFTLNYWSIKGRDKCCQFTIPGTKKDNIFEVYASGSGDTEGIIFMKGFPKKLKFNILRKMALSCAYDNTNYDNEHDVESDIKIRDTKVKDLIYFHARSIEDLNTISLIYHTDLLKEFYTKHKKNKKYKESAKTFRTDFIKIKKTDLYKTYKKMSTSKSYNTTGIKSKK